MSQTIISLTDDNFASEVLEAKLPVLVDFWAPWCGPCMAIAETVDQIAEEFEDKIITAKLNVDENTEIPSRYSVRSIPYFALFHKGELVDSLVGATPKAQLQEMIQKTLDA